MGRSSFFFAILLLATTAAAQKVAVIDATNSPPGSYYYQVIVTETGVTVIPLSQVISPGTTVNPTDPVSGTKAKVTALTKTAIANGGTKTTAKGLSALYKIVGKAYSDGSLGDLKTEGKAAAAKARNALDLASGAILREGKESKQWRAWLAGVKRIMAGNINTQTFYDIADGLEAAAIQSSAQASGATNEVAKGLFDNIDIAKLLEIIFTILKLLGIGI